MAHLIHVDGRITTVAPREGETAFAMAARLVGGPVEVLRDPAGGPRTGAVNEEGRLIGLPINRASAGQIHGPIVMFDDDSWLD